MSTFQNPLDTPFLDASSQPSRLTILQDSSTMNVTSPSALTNSSSSLTPATPSRVSVDQQPYSCSNVNLNGTIEEVVMISDPLEEYPSLKRGNSLLKRNSVADSSIPSEKETLTEKPHTAFNRKKKKKRKGFFKTIGFRRYYLPVTLSCLVGCSIYATIIVVLSLVFPSIGYCVKLRDNCSLKDGGLAYNTTALVVGAIWALIMLIHITLLLLAPGYMLHPNPRRVKIIALFCMLLITYPTGMLISPLITKRYLIVPYNRVQAVSFKSVGNGSRIEFEFSNFYGPWYSSNYTMVRIYPVLFPFRDSVSRYSPYSKYYIYSDTKSEQVEHVESNSTISRQVGGLKHGRTYAIMLLPARNHTRSAIPSSNYFTFEEEFEIDDNSKIVKDSYIDLRIIQVCKFHRSKGCS